LAWRLLTAGEGLPNRAGGLLLGQVEGGAVRLRAVVDCPASLEWRPGRLPGGEQVGEVKAAEMKSSRSATLPSGRPAAGTWAVGGQPLVDDGAQAPAANRE
jgi:hypothetical protein